ncbi:MAG TPA: GGDEF domain-containing protein [Candidatus Limnocylindrales bacterium]|nr:GGDEF domain-containing protein [Candidatus Limnocylindrales bacterium]
MPPEQTIIAVTAVLAAMLLVGVILAGRRAPEGASRETTPRIRQTALSPTVTPQHGALGDGRDAQQTLRVVWWLTITIVLLGVGISGSFIADQPEIFLLGGVAVVTVVIFHELLGPSQRGRLVPLAEIFVAVALIAGLLALTGFASSPFAMLFALVSVAAALAYGPRAGLTAAGLATAAFAGILFIDPQFGGYMPEDALRLSIGLLATWLLAFVAVAYAGHQRRAMARAIEQARTDPLTSLFNRAQLFVTLEQEVSRTRRSDRGFCVLMIDLDGLKAINDSGGHLRGDEVLRALGSVIRASIRTADSAYRYGGDEFVVLLPETDIVGAFVVAEKIRGGAEEVGMAMAGPEPVTSVSIGLVSHPEDGLSAEELMSAADRAMYQAKRLGKNQISGNPRPRPALLARRSAVAAPETPPTGPAPAPVTMNPPPAERQRGPAMAVTGPPEERAVAVRLGPILLPESQSASRHDEVDDADPQEVRRRIASASRSFDPDHQIRRAMDAFLSPVPRERERERPTADN